MDPEASDQQLATLRALVNPSGRFTVVVPKLDQAADATIACEIISIGYAHLAVAPMHEALSIILTEDLEPLIS